METIRGNRRDILLTFPSEDSLFELTVADVIDRTRAGSLTLDGARRRIREAYPRAVVYRRDGARPPGSSSVTAAFRDGGTEPVYQPEAWWLLPGTGRAVVNSRGRITSLNRAARLALAADDAVPRLPGLVTSLAHPDSALSLLGEVTSIANVDARDGEIVDFHMLRNGAGYQRHAVWFRTAREREAAAVVHAAEGSSLSAIPRGARTALLASAERRRLLPGERLATPMIDDAWAVLVAAGLVRVYATGPIESTVTYGRRACLLGSHLAFDDEAVGIQAITPAVVLRIDPRRISWLIDTSPAFARAILAEERKHVREIVRSQVMHATARQLQQLATELLLMDRLQATAGFLLVTEQQLADSLGSIRESVGRSMAKLRRMGAIATTRHGVLILDPARLASISLGAA